MDLSQVNFSAEGWYTAQVTATSHGYVSNPVDVRVRVAPVPALTLAATTATFSIGDTISQGAVIAQLEPVLDVPGIVRVGLKDVNPQAAGSYPVTVTATDQWGFQIAASATVVVLAPVPVTATPTDSS